MRATLTTLTLALSAVALAPATGAAADSNALRGAPQMRVVDADTVTVTFTTDKRVSRSAKVTVSDRGTASSKAIRAHGRHGNDFRYVATVGIRRAMEVGRKYTVTFSLGGATLKRLVVLRPAA